MWFYITLYFVIGVIVSLVNNHLYSKLQTKEQQIEDFPVMIIAMVAWIIFWPLGIVATIRMIQALLKF